MSGLVLEGADEAISAAVNGGRRQVSLLSVPHGTFVCLLGPVRLRQDDAAAHDRRTRGAERGRDPASTAATSPRVPTHQRNFGMVFQSLALVPASDRRREHRLSAAHPRRRRRQSRRSAVRRAARAGPPARLRRPPGRQALRRTAPARRDRPGAGALAATVPARRAAVGARRQAARGDAGRVAPAAAAARHHHHRRHARPARGHDHGRPRRGDGRGPHPPGGARRSRSTASRPTPSSPTSSARPICSPATADSAGRAPCSAGRIPGLSLPAGVAGARSRSGPRTCDLAGAGRGADRGTVTFVRDLGATIETFVESAASTIVAVTTPRERRDVAAGRQVGLDAAAGQLRGAEVMRREAPQSARRLRAAALPGGDADRLLRRAVRHHDRGQLLPARSRAASTRRTSCSTITRAS